MSEKQVVYVCAPYRAENAWDRECNIRVAEQAAFDVWQAGHIALCPHTNSRFFDGAIPDEAVLSGCLELLYRCDVVLVVGDRVTPGMESEIQFAKTYGIPVCHEIGEVLNSTPRTECVE